MMTTLKCIFQLIRKEAYLFFKEFFSRIIDISIILTTWVVVFGYLMGHTGLESSYGAFILVGAIASFGLFEITWRATLLAQDITDKKISNLLLLPLSSAAVFISIALSWTFCTSILNLCLFPLGKLLLRERFDLTHLSYVKFFSIFLVGNIFYGFFALWIASLVTNLRNTSWLWARVINPLYMFCGFFYTWHSAYDLSPWIGYLHLVNPLIYILEGTKAAVFGQEGYLPFWGCFFALIGFILLFSTDAIRRFKKRIDCV